jgi:hypothetical protein
MKTADANTVLTFLKRLRADTQEMLEEARAGRVCLEDMPPDDKSLGERENRYKEKLEKTISELDDAIAHGPMARTMRRPWTCH